MGKDGMKKKIAIIFSTWNDDYARDMIEGAYSRVKDEGCELHVFNAYEMTNRIDYYVKESEIFGLADAKKFDGLIVYMNGVSSRKETLTQTVERFTKEGKPVISIDCHVDGASFIGIDNFASEYEMTKHVIEEHGCRVFNFVGGPKDNEESRDRYEGYLACLKDHGIENDPRRAAFYHFLQRDGTTAYEDIKKSGLGFPDAIICANDYMAIGLLAEAGIDNGFRCPQDTIVVGFDCIDDANKNFPSITSVVRDYRKIGETAASHILSAIKGEVGIKEYKLAGSIKRNESCGCEKSRDLSEEYIELLTNTKKNDNLDGDQRRARAILCGNTNLSQLEGSLLKCSQAVKLPDIAVCINQNFLEDAPLDEIYDDTMNVYMTDRHEVLRRRTNLIPEKWEGAGYDVFIYAPMYFTEQTLGYIVTPYVESFFSRKYLNTLAESISISVEGIRQSMRLDAVNHKLQELYVLDSLTGLYNRFGYTALSGPCFRDNEGKVYIVYIDMDDLKYLNDTCGHDMGDMAIKAISAAIKESFTDTDIRVRMGGDEFLVMGPFTTEADLVKKENNVRKYLEKYSKSHGFPEPIGVSIGHSYETEKPQETGLEILRRDADAKMYSNKVERKKVNGKKPR